jgi:hypothetical protein
LRWHEGEDAHGGVRGAEDRVKTALKQQQAKPAAS